MYVFNRGATAHAKEFKEFQRAGTGEKLARTRPQLPSASQGAAIRVQMRHVSEYLV